MAAVVFLMAVVCYFSQLHFCLLKRELRLKVRLYKIYSLERRIFFFVFATEIEKERERKKIYIKSFFNLKYIFFQDVTKHGPEKEKLKT